MDEAASTGAEFKALMLGELFGALQEAPEEEQGRILKSFLLNSVDTMREHSIFQLELVEKLAFIALDNVQDVRLHSLEARVKELEQGKPVTFGQVLGELFFALTVEAALLGAVTYAGPVLAGGALLNAMLQATIKNPRVTIRALPAVRQFKAGQVVAEMRRTLLAQEGRLLASLDAPVPPALAQSSEQVQNTFRSLRKETTDRKLSTVRRWVTDLDSNRELALERVLDSMPLPEPILPASRTAEIESLSGKAKKFIEDYPHLIDGSKSEFRAFSLLAMKQYPEAFAGQTPQGEAVADAFTTTGATLEMVRECETLKLQVGLHYSRVRAIVDVVPEDGVFDAFETALVLEDVLENMFDLMDLSGSMLANLAGHVIPMEIAVWLLYLRANGALERDTAVVRRTVSGGGYAGWRFIGTDFVLSKLTEPDRLVFDSSGVTGPVETIYDGLSYPGLSVLDEHQVYYLFYKFAKPAFASYADRIPKSKTTEPSDFIHQHVADDAFSNVLSMQRVFFFTGENVERTTLIKEMGVVVIEFFKFIEGVVGQRKTMGFTASIPEGTVVSQLLDAIQAPTLEPLPPEVPPASSPTELLAKVKADDLLQWEETTRARLTSLALAYDTERARYDYHVAMNSKYLELLPESFYADAFLGPSRIALEKTYLAIDAEIKAIQEDSVHQSSVIDEMVDDLVIRIGSMPVERPFPTLFSE